MRSTFHDQMESWDGAFGNRHRGALSSPTGDRPFLSQLIPAKASFRPAGRLPISSADQPQTQLFNNIFSRNGNLSGYALRTKTVVFKVDRCYHFDSTDGRKGERGYGADSYS